MHVPGWIIDLVFGFLILLMTYALSSEGLWGAALMFFNVLFGGLIAFNFYEPLAALIDSTKIGWGFSDTLAMLAIFCAAVLILRMTTETLAPAMVRFPTPIYHAGRLFFALATSLVTMAILILSFHTAPVHKKIFGSIDYKQKPPFGLGLDHKWLGFFQYTTEEVFPRYGAAGTHEPNTVSRRFGNQRYPVHVFDPRATWLLTHQEARPYGEGSILQEGEGGGETAAGGGAGGAAKPGGPGGF